MTSKLQIRPEKPEDSLAIDALLSLAFGPGALARAAFRVREQAPHDPDLAFAGFYGDRLVASVRLTPIAIGATPGLLLGPLVVDPAHKNNGYGRALVAHALEAARAQGHRLVVLVGDAPYYGPLGFAAIPAGSVTMPGPVDPARLLAAELTPGAAVGLAGQIRGVRENG
jgi:predicted N-acetyltransferase YhbS